MSPWGLLCESRELYFELFLKKTPFKSYRTMVRAYGEDNIVHFFQLQPKYHCNIDTIGVLILFINYTIHNRNLMQHM